MLTILPVRAALYYKLVYFPVLFLALFVVFRHGDHYAACFLELVVVVRHNYLMKKYLACFLFVFKVVVVFTKTLFQMKYAGHATSLQKSRVPAVRHFAGVH